MGEKEKDLTFEEALERLQDIVATVKKREADLDKSLELLEEGVRLVNLCTKKIDVLREDVHSLKSEEEGGETTLTNGQG